MGRSCIALMCRGHAEAVCGGHEEADWRLHHGRLSRTLNSTKYWRNSTSLHLLLPVKHTRKAAACLAPRAACRRSATRPCWQGEAFGRKSVCMCVTNGWPWDPNARWPHLSTNHGCTRGAGGEVASGLTLDDDDELFLTETSRAWEDEGELSGRSGSKAALGL